EDLMKRGISRGRIPATIDEGEQRKLIEAKRSDAWPLLPNGKRAPNRYRLTYLPTRTTDENAVETWHRPTDEWRFFVEPVRAKRLTFRRTRESISTRPKMVLGSVPKTVRGEKPELRKTAKNRVPKTVPEASTKDGTSYKTLGSPRASPAPEPL